MGPYTCRVDETTLLTLYYHFVQERVKVFERANYLRGPGLEGVLFLRIAFNPADDCGRLRLEFNSEGQRDN